jgi:hypothetical protein
VSAETSIAGGVASAFEAADALPEVALVSTLFATFDIPAALLCAGAMLGGLAMPGGIGKAAVSWAETGEKIQDAANKLQELVDAIPDDAWSKEGDDRKAFDQKVNELKAQFVGGHVYADVVATALLIIGGVIVVYDLAMAAIGVLLMFEATALAATIASVVGNLGASEAEAAADNAEATAIAADIESSNEIMQTVSQTTAAVLVAGLAIFEGYELFKGDTNVGSDLLKGTVIALPDIALATLAGAAGKYGGEAKGGAHAAPSLLEKIPGFKAAGEAAAKVAPGTLAKDVADYFLPGTGRHAASALDPVIRQGINKVGNGLADLLGDRGAEEGAKKGSEGLGKWLEE